MEFYFPIHLIPINHPDIYMSWISYFSPFYNFGYFILGCFIGRLALLQKAKITFTIYKYLALTLIISLSFFINDQTHFEYYKPILIEISIGILLLIILSPNSYLGYIFSLRPLVWIGDLSASIFLIHGAINYNLKYIENSIEKPLLFFIALTITIIASLISEKYLILKRNENILQHIRKITQSIF